MSERPKPESDGGTISFTREGVQSWLQRQKIKTNLWTFLAIVALAVYSDRRVAKWEHLLTRVVLDVENDTVRVEDLDEYGRETASLNTNWYFRAPSAEGIVADRLKRQARRQHASENMTE